MHPCETREINKSPHAASDFSSFLSLPATDSRHVVHHHTCLFMCFLRFSFYLCMCFIFEFFFFESVGVDCTNTILKHCVLSMMNYIHMDFDKPKLNRQAWFVVWLFRRGNIFSKRMMRNGEFSISGALKFCSDLLDKKKETFFNNFK